MQEIQPAPTNTIIQWIAECYAFTRLSDRWWSRVPPKNRPSPKRTLHIKCMCHTCIHAETNTHIRATSLAWPYSSSWKTSCWGWNKYCKHTKSSMCWRKRRKDTKGGSSNSDNDEKRVSMHINCLVKCAWWNDDRTYSCIKTPLNWLQKLFYASIMRKY